MFTAKVYKVMVGSLSGTMEEVFTAKEVVCKHNQDNAESLGKLLLPVEWSMKPEYLQMVDVIIGIVGNWIDKPYFIEDCLKAGKKVLLFFNTYQDPKNTIKSEQEEVKAFRARIQNQCHCVEYCSTADLKKLVEGKLNTL